MARRATAARQSYMHLPMVRMTNTYVLDGTEEPDDIVAATITVCTWRSSAAAASTPPPVIVFGMTEAYLIENGRITEPLREGNLIGNGPQVLLDIDMLGHDFAMGTTRHVRQGRSGRAGRRRPADPARVKALTIGGTAA